MTGVNFQRTYALADSYESIKQRAFHILQKFINCPAVITFNDEDRSVTFTSEKLIPPASTNRPRIMVLFSNPHPHSIQQGMFLSPDIKGQPNLFWSVMKNAGWITTAQERPNPKRLADICLNVEYAGPFELIFYCYYAFPTNYPENISKLFGKEYFDRYIETEATEEFKETIRDNPVEAVVTFNKGIFNLVSKDPIDRYIACLKAGGLIQSQIKGIGRSVPIFLTYPTGWHYAKEHRRLRSDHLTAISRELLGS
jgi:hypothetical protein